MRTTDTSSERYHADHLAARITKAEAASMCGYILVRSVPDSARASCLRCQSYRTARFTYYHSTAVCRRKTQEESFRNVLQYVVYSNRIDTFGTLLLSRNRSTFFSQKLSQEVSTSSSVAHTGQTWRSGIACWQRCLRHRRRFQSRSKPNSSPRLWS